MYLALFKLLMNIQTSYDAYASHAMSHNFYAQSFANTLNKWMVDPLRPINLTGLFTNIQTPYDAYASHAVSDYFYA